VIDTSYNDYVRGIRSQSGFFDIPRGGPTTILIK
jgi:hypothetical protein